MDQLNKLKRETSTQSTEYRKLKQELTRLAQLHEQQAHQLADHDQKARKYKAMAVSLRDYSKSLEASLNSSNPQEMQHLRMLYEESQGKLYDMTEQRDAAAKEVEALRAELSRLSGRAVQSQWHNKWQGQGKEVQTSPVQTYTQGVQSQTQTQPQPLYGQTQQTQFGQQSQQPQQFQQPQAQAQTQAQTQSQQQPLQQYYQATPELMQPFQQSQPLQQPLQHQQQQPHPFLQPTIHQHQQSVPPVNVGSLPQTEGKGSAAEAKLSSASGLAPNTELTELVNRLLQLISGQPDTVPEEAGTGNTNAETVSGEVNANANAGVNGNANANAEGKLKDLPKDNVEAIREMLAELVLMQKTGKSAKAKPVKEKSKDKAKDKTKKSRVRHVEMEDESEDDDDNGNVSVESGWSTEDSFEEEEVESEKVASKKVKETKRNKPVQKQQQQTTQSKQAMKPRKRIIDRVNALSSRKCQVCSREEPHSHITSKTLNPSQHQHHQSSKAPVYNNLDDDDAWDHDDPTPRPSMAPVSAVQLIVSQMGSELSRLQTAYSDLISEYTACNPSLAKHRRRDLAGKLKGVVDEMEKKADQIYAMYDVLRGGEVPEVEEVEFPVSVGGAATTTTGVEGGHEEAEDGDEMDSLMGRYSWIQA